MWDSGPTKPELILIYCTVSEFTQFKHLRSTGYLSFFRTRPCEWCGCEIPKSKRLCSEKHYDLAVKACEAIAMFVREAQG